MPNGFYNAPVNEIPLTTIRSSSENSDRGAVEAAFDLLPVEADLKRSEWGVDSSSVATLYIITTPDHPAAYTVGQVVSFEAKFANTGPASIQVNGGVNVSIHTNNGVALSAGAILVGQVVTVVYTSDATFKMGETSGTAGASNLSYTAAVSQGTVVNSSGTDAVIPAVGGTNAGLMLASHKAKVDFIAVTQAVNLDTIESDTAVNNAKATNVTTNLSYVQNAADGVVESSDGTNATVLAVTTSKAGLMLPADKVKSDHITVTQAVDLDEMESGITSLESIRHTKLANAMFRGFMTNKLQETSAPTDTKADISWIRAGGKTYVDRYGELKYSPSPDATNLAIHSANLSNAAWTVLSSTKGSDVTTAPDGTLSADSVIGDGAASAHGVRQNLTSAIADGAIVTVSAFAKRGDSTHNTFAIQMYGNAGAWLGGRAFDLNTGTHTSTDGSGTLRHSITLEDDGWYRCSVTFQNDSGVSTPNIRIYGGSYADTKVSFYIWGAQLEESRVANGYVKTTTVAATGTSYVGIEQATEESEGWLIEGGSTNLLLHSHDYTNAAWSQGSATEVTGRLAPDGSLTATSLTATLTGTAMGQVHTGSGAGVTLTGSVWMRRVSGVGDITLIVGLNSGNTITSQVTSEWTQVFATSVSDSATWRFYISMDVIGDEIEVWNSQLEESPVHTSTIITTTASVARSADVVTVAILNNLPDDTGERTVSAQVKMKTTGANSTIIDASVPDGMWMLLDSNGNYLGRNGTNYTGGALNQQTSDVDSVIFAADAINSDLYVNGVLGATVSNGALGGTDVTGSLVIGNSSLTGGTNSAFMHLKNLEIHGFKFNSAEAKYLGVI